MVQMVRSLADRTFQLWEIPDSSSVSSRPPPSEAFEPFELFELLLALVGDAVGAGVGAPVGALVERFDIEPYSDFSAKWSHFIRLDLCCIDAKFCKKIFVGKLLTRSTRFTCFCTAQTSIFQKKFVKLFRIFRQNFANLPIFETFSLNFAESFSRNFLSKFCKIYSFSKNFHWILLRVWWNFIGISQIFSKMLRKY